METKTLKAQYKNHYYRYTIFLILLSIGLLLLMFFLLGIGVSKTSYADIGGAIIRGIFGIENEWSASDKIILLIRMPRIIMAALTGAALAISGTVMQSITRNPLVSPFTIGISAAATFGAALYVLFGYLLGGVSDIGVMISAFVTAVLCAATVYALANKMGTGATTLILIGIGGNYLFSAGTSILQFFAEEYKLAMIVNWTFGSFNNITWQEVVVSLLPICIVYVLLQAHAQKLNAMIAGDDEVLQALGTDPATLRRNVGIMAIFITAITICFTGIIGFVGLIAPHMARMLVGNNHTYLLPFSALIGGWLVLLADSIGHQILSPVVLPVGVVIAFLGVPLFVHLILKQRSKAWE